MELLNNGELANTLEELIAALDRRMPHLEREGEAAIANDAAKLRATAIKRLGEITGASRAGSELKGTNESEG